MKAKAFWTSRTNIVALIPIALAALSAYQSGGTWQTIVLAVTGPIMVFLRSLTTSPIVWKFVVDVLNTAANATDGSEAEEVDVDELTDSDKTPSENTRKERRRK